jgi:hypothetical protein
MDRYYYTFLVLQYYRNTKHLGGLNYCELKMNTNNRAFNSETFAQPRYLGLSELFMVHSFI